MINDTSRRDTIVLALAFALTPVYAQQPLKPPLTNWAAPLYWAPTAAVVEQQRLEQRIAQPNASPLAAAQAAGIFTAPGPMTFIAITPCRIMDTRGAPYTTLTGAFGPPSLAANSTRQVPLPSSPGSPVCTTPLPTNAGAYSLNITAISPPGQALSFLSVWPAGQAYPGVSTLNDSVAGGVIANAAIVPAGTAGAIQMVAGNLTDVIIDINGYYIAPTDVNNNTAVGVDTLASNTTGEANTASGAFALQSNTTGGANTAIGGAALQSNTTGMYNTASGAGALQDNTTGNGNTAIGVEALQDNTTGMLNTASGGGALQNNTTGNNNTAAGSSALFNNTTGSNNTAVGQSALSVNTTGSNNTATGYQALQNSTGSNSTATGYQALQNSTGNSNTATGSSALFNNTTGFGNTATGEQAMGGNTTGAQNTATGRSALQFNTTGTQNVADGFNALTANTTGFQNTASGWGALSANTTGGNNIAMGYLAASSVAAGNNNNIHIGSAGVSTDGAAATGVIRIGTVGTQTGAYIAGIWGNTPNVANLLVCVDANGDLGTTGCTNTPSSRRFKEQISDMGDSSSKLLQLRPVTFFYKPQYDDGSHALQYGLIAEEVATLYPDMVGYDKDGQPSSVKYQSLAPMLLNEVQKQNAQNRKQAEQIRSLEERLAAMEALLSGQASAAARPAGSQ